MVADFYGACEECPNRHGTSEERATLKELRGLLLRCLTTGNPVGTDTWRVGQLGCGCQVCDVALVLGLIGPAQ